MKKSTIFLLLSLSLITYQPVNAQDTLSAITIDGFALRNANDSNLVVLDSFRHKKAIALVFFGTYCSFCKNYTTRLNKMAKEFEDQNVGFLAINSNHPDQSDENTFEGMMAARPFWFPYLHDSTQEIARALEVTINPEALILIPEDSVFRLVYRGKIDNIPLNLPGVQSQLKPFLANALEDVLQAKSPLVPKTALGGCHIKWIDKEDSIEQE